MLKRGKKRSLNGVLIESEKQKKKRSVSNGKHKVAAAGAEKKICFFFVLIHSPHGPQIPARA